MAAHVQLDRQGVHHIQLLDRNRRTTNPSDHQTAGNPLDPMVRVTGREQARPHSGR